MSIHVCGVCKRIYDINDDGNRFDRIEGICKTCWDEKLDEEQHAYEDSKKKPSSESWDPTKEGSK
jgi:hypothetical protein